MSIKAQEKVYRSKPCKACNKTFTPDRPLQSVCSWQCGIERAKQQHAAKIERDAKREKTKAIKKLNHETKKYWIKEAERICNEYIRKRDEGQPCISCGSTTAKIYHAGHYKAAGNNSAIRFHELNIHRQCYSCNVPKSGNLTEYRINLIKKVGIETVEWLEMQKQIKDWSIDELKGICEYYKQKIKTML